MERDGVMTIHDKIEAVANSGLGLTERAVILTFIALLDARGTIVSESRLNDLRADFNLFGPVNGSIKKLRRVICPQGFVIETLYGIGWRMKLPKEWAPLW
jgi:hypothetical protein